MGDGPLASSISIIGPVARSPAATLRQEQEELAVDGHQFPLARETASRDQDMTPRYRGNRRSRLLRLRENRLLLDGRSKTPRARDDDARQPSGPDQAFI